VAGAHNAYSDGVNKCMFDEWRVCVCVCACARCERSTEKNRRRCTALFGFPSLRTAAVL
jgi:hypothetical protein